VHAALLSSFIDVRFATLPCPFTLLLRHAAGTGTGIGKARSSPGLT
jgi:hypothetical protein